LRLRTTPRWAHVSIFPPPTGLDVASSSEVNAWSSSAKPGRSPRRPSRCVLPRRSQPSSNRPERNVNRRSAPPRQVRRDADEEALAQRESGKTFAAVARTVGFNRANEAHRAFLRALRKREAEDRNNLVRREYLRLDRLETRIRTRDASDPQRMERRLAALAKMREMLE
jgi:hypothetical protein